MKLENQELEITAAALAFAKMNIDNFKMYLMYQGHEDVANATTHKTLDHLRKQCWERFTQTYKDTEAIQELQNVMTVHPLDGIVTRKEFDTFCIGGHKIVINNLTVIASHNYKCLEPYSQDQKIQLMGVHLTVYIDGERSQSTVIYKPEDIEPAIQSLKEQCEKLCNHQLRKELSYQTCKERNIPHSGMHCHVFECFSCKHIFSVDSSG